MDPYLDPIGPHLGVSHCKWTLFRPYLDPGSVDLALRSGDLDLGSGDLDLSFGHT